MRWGRNLELFFLDERSFRSAKADEGRVCDNAQTGEPDLVPTMPQSTRNLFAPLRPSLAQPVAPACLEAIRSERRTFLGKRQLSRFLRDVRRSSARFKVIVNETPIQQYYAQPYDRWEG
jgi:phosphodiesterase/alkaline phosphatase D-like protein